MKKTKLLHTIAALISIITISKAQIIYTGHPNAFYIFNKGQINSFGNTAVCALGDGTINSTGNPILESGLTDSTSVATKFQKEPFIKKKYKTSFLKNSLIANSLNDVPDGDDIPYGMSEVSGILDIDHYRDYFIENRLVNGANTDVIRKQTGTAQLGLGFDVHCCFTNMFGLYNDAWRFRIGEDVGFSISVLNGLKLSGFAGLQGIYRLGELVDLGIKYYPVYGMSWWSGGSGKMVLGNVGNNAFGLHTRIGPVYIDYTNIKANSKNGFGDPTRFHLFKIKCNYDDFDGGTFISLSFGMAHFSTGVVLDQYSTPEYVEYSKLKNRITTIQLGWGVAF